MRRRTRPAETEVEQPARRPRAEKDTVRAKNSREFASIDFGDDDDDGGEVETRRAVKRPPIAPAKVIKTPLVKRPRTDDDDDFTDKRKVGNVVRKIRRPSLH